MCSFKKNVTVSKIRYAILHERTMKNGREFKIKNKWILRNAVCFTKNAIYTISNKTILCAVIYSFVIVSIFSWYTI